ncbi:branched chain amino acid aminotransferase [Pedobacter quisquiliarum]|jgi:branched-chain amino acid aminotransferase|uniref:branched-chain-amino-acid transaminase n=1 Tax=Pedobacter quisquiliarum TaxID=1834438 RepID=A0A916UEW8_9SPHI|nr:aminotransferase class IV [Pedobacter quisquiliarum]GGC70150.1 branched chain amino acid aminotransferase [Pedobacter quisquiliarum]
MQEYILHNDNFILSNQPVLPVSNRSFKFGDGLFESMRMCNGKLMYPEQHADRLMAGMKALKLDGSSLMDEYFLKQKAVELVKRNRLRGDVRLRLSIYREGDGLYTPEGNSAGYVLEASPLPDTNYQLNKRGLIVDVYDEITKPINILSNFKTSNALLYVMAGLYKKQNNLDDVFMLNQQGFLCESMSSNIFVVYEKQIYTPALSEGCVSGVMRSVVMELAKSKRITITEAQLNPEVLKQAEEVFITNAVGGIRWVMGYGRKRYFNENAKMLSAMLNDTVPL